MKTLTKVKSGAFKTRKSTFVTLFAIAALTICCDVAVPGLPERVFVSDVGRFEATFPREPESSRRRVEVGPDLSFDMNSFTVETKSPMAKYSVHYFDLPEWMDGPADEAFESAAEGGLEEVGARELSRKDIKVGEYPGRILTAAKPDGSFMKVKFVLASRRFYQVMAYFQSEGRSFEESTRDYEALADKFLESFKLLPQ